MLRLLLVVAALAGIAAAAVGNAHAAGNPFASDFCKTAPADRTLALGVGVPSVTASVSGFATYAGNPCPRYVVDIVVPSSSSGGPGYFDDFTVGGGILNAPSSSSVCASASESVRVYRKTGNGEFVSIGGGRTTGTWNPGGGFVSPHCQFVKAPGYVDVPSFSPPSYQYLPDVYRVAVAATAFGDVPVPVRVRAWHAPFVG